MTHKRSEAVSRFRYVDEAQGSRDNAVVGVIVRLSTMVEAAVRLTVCTIGRFSLLVSTSTPTLTFT